MRIDQKKLDEVKRLLKAATETEAVNAHCGSGLSSRPPPFVVTEPEPSTVQLSLQNPVLLAQEFDSVAFLPLEPPAQQPMMQGACSSGSE